MKYLFTLLAFLPLGCSTPQATASATYIAAEVATTALIQKNPSLIPSVHLLAADWKKYQGGTITSADEVALLQNIVTATKAKITPVEAALLDGAVKQVLANQNATAPVPLAGAAADIVTTVLNGAEEAATIYVVPAP